MATQIKLPGGRLITGRLIGRGLFTRAIEADPGVVWIETADPVKEIYARVRGAHIPRFDWIGFSTRDRDVYRAPRYDKLRKAHAQAWRDYLGLRACYRAALDACLERSLDSCEVVRHMQDTIANYAVSESVQEAFQTLATHALNWDDVCVEVSPRNLAVDDGRLVLLDLFFSREAARQKRR